MTPTTKPTTYNGWPNRQTWNVMLWMDNDEGLYRAYRAAVEAFKQEKKRFNGSDAKDICIECMGEKTPDGVKLADSKIRWGRIAEAMREE